MHPQARTLVASLRTSWCKACQRGYGSASVASAFQARITAGVCSRLSAEGFVVVDNLFEPAMGDRLREEVLGLYRAGLMHHNHTHLVKDNATRLLEKHDVHEAELTLDPEIQAKVPLCAQLNADRSLAVMLSLFLPHLSLDAQAIKLQVNSGNGGSFPLHFDSDEALDGRKVTCIFYLNPSWQPGDGGELRLYPFPQRAPVDVAPLHNRLVLFSPTKMLHRVLPCHMRERVCFTIWLSQSRRTRARARAPLPAAAAAGTRPDGATAQLLLQPHLRKHVLKLVYAEEWAASIEQSHPPGVERDAVVEQHWKEVALIRTALEEHQDAIASLAALSTSEDASQRQQLSLDWI